MDAVKALPAEPAHDGLPALSAERLAVAALRERFRSHDTVAWTPEILGDRLDDGSPKRAAAVLVPIVARGHRPTVLLTQRTEHLSTHSGQVAFPGGGVEPHDRDPVETALRETLEEVGLETRFVDVIGRLPQYTTGTGFEVTPVVGIVAPEFALRLDPSEVADAFEVPLDFLMDPGNHERRRYEVGGRKRTFFVMPYRRSDDAPEYFIWGATAAMIRNLYRFLSV